MTLPVATAAPGGWEGPLVSGLDRSGTGVAVVRRCVDVPELLACSAAGLVRAVLVAADLRRLDTEVLARLTAAGVAVVGLTRSADDPAAADLRRLGVVRVVAADADPVTAAAEVSAAVAELAADRPRSGVGDADPAASLPDPPADAAVPVGDDEVDGGEEVDGDGGGHGDSGGHGDQDGDGRPRRGPVTASRPGPGGGHDGVPPRDGTALRGGPGRLVAVWGPAGSPGRTTVAATLAAELAERCGADRGEVLLADADTWAASLAQVLGVLDEAPGIAAACRAAGHGSLDAAALARVSRALRPGLRLLTGIRSSRWPEIGAAALDDVWRVARATSAWTVVDCAASLEQDEELSFDVAAPRRNAATLVTLAAADEVVAVGAADPVGVQRLVRGLQDLRETVPHVTPRVVLTRVRAGAVGGSPRRRLLDALARYAGVRDAVLVPDDRPALDAALLAGRTLTEHAPSSPARLALTRLAADLCGAPDRDRTPGRVRRRRR